MRSQGEDKVTDWAEAVGQHKAAESNSLKVFPPTKIKYIMCVSQHICPAGHNTCITYTCAHEKGMGTQIELLTHTNTLLHTHYIRTCIYT